MFKMIDRDIIEDSKSLLFILMIYSFKNTLRQRQDLRCPLLTRRRYHRYQWYRNPWFSQGRRMGSGHQARKYVGRIQATATNLRLLQRWDWI